MCWDPAPPQEFQVPTSLFLWRSVQVSALGTAMRRPPSPPREFSDPFLLGEVEIRDCNLRMTSY